MNTPAPAWASPEEADDDLFSDTDKLTGAVPSSSSSTDASSQPQKSPGLFWCFSVSTYQKYFDCTTARVLSFLPLPFLTAFNPSRRFPPDDFGGSILDMYVMFWNAMVLTFTVAVTSNLDKWSNVNPEDGQGYIGEIDAVFKAMGVIFGWVVGVPLSVWAFWKCFATSKTANTDGETTTITTTNDVDFTKLLSLYGYAMVWFTPASLLCVIPIPGLQWALLLASAIGSALFFAKNLDFGGAAGTSDGGGEQNRKAIWGFIIGAQVVLVLVLKLKFYVH